MSKQFNLVFLRNEGIRVTTMAILSVQTEDRFNDKKSVLEAIEEGLSEWRENTPTGKQAWEDTCADFNVGDLSQHEDDAEVLSFLRKEGVLSFQFQSLLDDIEPISYDRVLMD